MAKFFEGKREQDRKISKKGTMCTRRQGDKEFREFKTYVCQHRILKKPEERRMAGNKDGR